jgi:hypothetical protein
VLKEKDKIDKHQVLPIHKDGIINPRLKSRKPYLLRAQIITESRVNTPDEWQFVIGSLEGDSDKDINNKKIPTANKNK